MAFIKSAPVASRASSPEIIINKNGGSYILYDPSTQAWLASADITATESPITIEKLFDAKFLKTQQLVDKIAQGRAETIFFSIDNTSLVLRHYHRGGLVARLSSDCYLWLGLARTRAYRELAMLTSLSTSNLPAPKPFAIRVIHNGFYYRADIITHALADTETLSQQLQRGPVDHVVWREIGATIAKFHERGVYHADLNAHNILLNGNRQVFVIDFDKARFENPGIDIWRQQNLQRLYRSLVKLNKNSAAFYFSDHDWSQLKQGYCNS